MIQIFQVSKCFHAGKTNEFTALDNVTLNIAPGQVTVLKGPSGSGKTTLLSLVGCMARPSSGRIQLHGVRTTFAEHDADDMGLDISSLPERFLTDIRRTTFGFIFQQFNLIKGITVLENIMLPAYPTGERQPAIRKRAEELLQMFAITRHSSAKVDWLSGGELQRVAIARALINNPAIIIADEPTAHLDSKLSAEFMDIIGTFRSAGKTVVIASHDPLVFASTSVDRVVEMRDGRITDPGLSS